MTTNLLANEESANEENSDTNGEENKVKHKKLITLRLYFDL